MAVRATKEGKSELPKNIFISYFNFEKLAHSKQIEFLHKEALREIDEKKFELPKEMHILFLSFMKLSNNKQLELIQQLSKIESLPPTLLNLIKFKHSNYLATLPKEIFKLIGDCLGNSQSLSALVTTYKGAYKLFQPKRISTPFHTFLKYVVTGEQNRVAKMLSFMNPKEQQEWLSREGTTTDYSGRTFTCTAYEYSYWAKDTRMCTMLEKYMDADTKKEILKKCEAIEREGLCYKQHGILIKNSKHFDFTALKTVLNTYVLGYWGWYQTKDWAKMKTAWMDVGMAQRDVPAHVAHEYCHPTRSFEPTPTFTEAELPRSLNFPRAGTTKIDKWFPLVSSDTYGLGVSFAVSCPRLSWSSRNEFTANGASFDLDAIKCLDDVRTNELRQLLENLKSEKRSELDNSPYAP